MKKPTFPRQIFFKFTIAITICLLVIFFSLGIIISEIQKQTQLRATEENAKALIQQFSDSSAVDINRFTYYLLDENVTRLQSQTEILSATIFDNQGSKLTASSIPSESINLPKKYKLLKTSPCFYINHQGNKKYVGHAEIIFSLEEIYRKADQMRNTFFLVIVIAVIILDAVVIILLRHFVTNPLKLLGRIAMQLAAGDFNLSNSVRTRHEFGFLEEILIDAAGKLAANFDQIEEQNEKLFQAHQELKKHGDHLKELVSERTKELLESEKRFRNIVQSSPMGIHLYELKSDNSLILIDANRAAERFIGLHENTLIGKTIEEAFPQLINTEIPYRYRQAAAEGKFWQKMNFRLKDDPEKKIYDLYAFQTSQGRMAVMFFDVTQRRRAEKELDEARKSAEVANLSKSEFLANMSHELRTPLNAVIGFSELLSTIVADAKQKSYLTSIKAAGKSLLTLINDILDLSKIEVGKMEVLPSPVKLVTIIKEIQQLFQLKVQDKGIDFIIELEPSLPEVLNLDETRMRQILLNLVGNAVKFTEKGHVRLSAQTTDSFNNPEAVDLTISIEDTGIGIASADQLSIFDAFQQKSGQNEHKYGGTGLGLTICKRLVELMDGEISVESAEGFGSCFRLVLRNVEISKVEVNHQNDYVFDIEQVNFQQEKVLIVEDNRPNLEMMRELLEKLNLTVFTATDGEESIARAREKIPDLILMDIELPVMDGIEATRRLKTDAATKEIPIIAFTASNKIDHQVVDTEGIGFSGHLPKPLDIKKLVEAFSMFLNHTESIQSRKEKEAECQEQMVADILSKHPRFAAILQQIVLPEIEKMNGALSMSKVHQLAQIFEAVAHDSGVSKMQEYAKRLYELEKTFDVSGIRDVCVDFSEFYKLLVSKEVAHGR